MQLLDGLLHPRERGGRELFGLTQGPFGGGGGDARKPGDVFDGGHETSVVQMDLEAAVRREGTTRAAENTAPGHEIMEMGMRRSRQSLDKTRGVWFTDGHETICTHRNRSAVNSRVERPPGSP
ncbi:hypothetical protein GCM10010841_20160 [Deinococcus aerophilus]|uniref:Uncharacterized protein n=1 Tax=Deinococcus aerophilus TaxID=522488 RepID=A0ABQ2GSU1_9DEIO|nr:hypothetical protein GCM10010841_20160 [Deinococcus aerophilus]